MKTLNIGLVGSGLMGKAHSLAYANVSRIFDDLSVRPRLLVLGDISDEIAGRAAADFGFEEHVAGWQGVVEHPEVDIVDITAPNQFHPAIAIAAARAGKHIYCEKPLATTAADARQMLVEAQKAGVTTLVGFNYLKAPATLAAKSFINEGLLGEIWSFRGTFQQDILADPSFPHSWRFERQVAGPGALGDLGAHVIALAHELVGDIARVSALGGKFIRQRPASTATYGYSRDATVQPDSSVELREVENEDSIHVLAEFARGATGVIEASRVAHGRKTHLAYEIYGSKGSLAFDHERMNELKLYLADDREGTRGFRTIITGPEHPYYGSFWPVAGCGLGFGDMKMIEVRELLQGVANGSPLRPDFHDGYKVNLVIDAAAAAAEEGNWVEVETAGESRSEVQGNEAK